MQFKPQGRRVQVLAYRGYDKDKRRAVVKMLGSYDGYSFEPSVGLIDNLTDEEKKELQSHFEKVRQSREKESRQWAAKLAADGFRKVAAALDSGDFEPSAEWVNETTAAFRVLAKSLRKARRSTMGPEAPKTAPETPDPNQGTLPLSDSPETP